MNYAVVARLTEQRQYKWLFNGPLPGKAITTTLRQGAYTTLKLVLVFHVFPGPFMSVFHVFPGPFNRMISNMSVCHTYLLVNNFVYVRMICFN